MLVTMLVLLLVGLLPEGVHANLKVCIVIDPGFDMLVDASAGSSVVTQNSQIKGFNAEVRKEVLETVLNYNYSVKVYDSWAEVNVRVRAQDCDIGWAAYYVRGDRDRCVPTSAGSCKPVSQVDFGAADLSPFRCCVDFSVQYFPWHISIMAPVKGRQSFFNALQAGFTDPFLVNFVCFAFIFMAIGAHAMWMAERHENPKAFPRRYLDGIDDGIWWAMVTATTVGYGDLVPVTPMGRIIAMIFMIVGIGLFGILSGHLAAAFVKVRQAVSARTTLASLAGGRVCGYRYVLDTYDFGGIQFTKVPCVHMTECGDMLRTGQADAMVFDEPSMAYWRKTDPWASSASLLIGQRMNTPPVGLMFPEGGLPNGQHAQINIALIDFITSTPHGKLISKWFPSGMADGLDASDLSEPLEWPIIGVAVGLVGVYAVIQVWLKFRKRSEMQRTIKKADRVLKSSAEISGIHAPAIPSTLRVKVAKAANGITSSMGSMIMPMPKAAPDESGAAPQTTTEDSRGINEKLDFILGELRELGELRQQNASKSRGTDAWSEQGK